MAINETARKAYQDYFEAQHEAEVALREKGNLSPAELQLRALGLGITAGLLTLEGIRNVVEQTNLAVKEIHQAVVGESPEYFGGYHPDAEIRTSIAGKLIGASSASVRILADKGTIPCTRTEGGHRMFTVRDLREYASAQLIKET